MTPEEGMFASEGIFASVWFDNDLDVDRGDIEAELVAIFRGIGRVSGAGAGKMGCHLDPFSAPF
jgi:hypothetical protein